MLRKILKKSIKPFSNISFNELLNDIADRQVAEKGAFDLLLLEQRTATDIGINSAILCSLLSAEMLLGEEDSAGVIEARVHLETARLLFDQALRLANHSGESTLEKFGWDKAILLSIIAQLEAKAGL